jgi:hypothetical protein
VFSYGLKGKSFILFSSCDRIRQKHIVKLVTRKIREQTSKSKLLKRSDDMAKKTKKLNLEISLDRIKIGENLTINFQRTLRIPDDNNTYPLPPGLGNFPICKVSDYLDRVPESWKDKGDFFIPMYQREALWINFNGAYWHPNAVKIAVGKVNAISGKRLHRGLNKTEQNYMVCPDQPWLDGINAGKGFIRQFVAMPLGMGYTIEGQITGKEVFGGIQIIAYEPKPGKFPNKPPISRYNETEKMLCDPCACDMGLAAGGKMEQEIYPDEYGASTWDQDNYKKIYIHIVNSMMFREITGMEAPPTPVSARTYTEYGYPWFKLYDVGKGDLKGAKNFNKVK